MIRPQYRDIRYDTIYCAITNTVLENVNNFKYLGVILDQQLDFNMQVDYSVSKAKRAGAKVSSLIAGRKGLPVQIVLHVVLCDTVNTFKSRLDKFWQYQDIVYDYKAEIHGTGSRSLHV